MRVRPFAGGARRGPTVLLARAAAKLGVDDRLPGDVTVTVGLADLARAQVALPEGARLRVDDGILAEPFGDLSRRPADGCASEQAARRAIAADPLPRAGRPRGPLLRDAP